MITERNILSKKDDFGSIALMAAIVVIIGTVYISFYIKNNDTSQDDLKTNESSTYSPDISRVYNPLEDIRSNSNGLPKNDIENLVPILLSLQSDSSPKYVIFTPKNNLNSYDFNKIVFGKYESEISESQSKYAMYIEITRQRY